MGMRNNSATIDSTRLVYQRGLPVSMFILYSCYLFFCALCTIFRTYVLFFSKFSKCLVVYSWYYCTFFSCCFGFFFYPVLTVCSATLNLYGNSCFTAICFPSITSSKVLHVTKPSFLASNSTVSTWAAKSVPVTPP